MTAIPLQKRTYHTFLSHSSADKAVFVDGLWSWLQEVCGLAVYYDREAPLTGIASQVAEAIGNSQSGLFVVSKHAKASGWVQREFDALHEEAMNHEKGLFRLVGIQIDEDDEPFSLLKGAKVLKAPNAEFKQKEAISLLESLFGGGDPTGGKALYFSRGWHARETAFADAVQAGLNECNFRIVRDWPAFSHTGDRVDRLIGCCGAFVALLPWRESEPSTTSRGVLKEIASAQKYDLPCVVFAEPNVTIDPKWDFTVTQLDAAAVDKQTFREKYGSAVEALESDWRMPPLGKHVFVGHSDVGSVLSPLRKMIGRLTGLPVIYGRDLKGGDVPKQIIQSIRDAEFCVMDITNPHPSSGLPDKANYALNSSIEAGIAAGAGRPVYFTCAGEKNRSPPFMFRTDQVCFYKNEVELAGYVSQFALMHRRLVVR